MSPKTMFKRKGWNMVVNELVTGSPQAEIRNGKGVVIIVSLGNGYIYKHYGKPHYWITGRDPIEPTRGVNIHLATSGPIQCTFTEWDEINLLIDEASDMLFEIYHAREVWHGTGEEGKFAGLNDIMEELGY